jgi:hypothetical protein
MKTWIKVVLIVAAVYLAFSAWMLMGGWSAESGVS